MIIYQFENIGNPYDYKHNCHSDWHVPPHMHEYSEFIFTQKGTFYMNLGGKEYTVPENHLIFVRSNQIHDCHSEAPSIVHCIVFSNDFAPLFHSAIKDMELENPVFNFSNYTEIIKEINKTDSSKTLRLCGLLNIVLDIILENCSLIPKSKINLSQDIFHSIIKHVSSNFKEDIRLSDIAKELGYHEKYLSSTIHSITGMNFRTFLSLYRIDYAKKLLNSRFTISEIATLCGFSSINTFNRMFLKIAKMTPSEFKKRNCGKIKSQHSNNS